MKPPEPYRNPDEIEIDLEDVQRLMGTDYPDLPDILDNVFCGTCDHHTTTIRRYRIYLNTLNDVIFRGYCSRCDQPVARYIETGEDLKKANAAKQIRTKKKNKTGKI